MTHDQRRQDLRIENLPISSLIPNPRNACRHARKQVNKLARIIKTLGFSEQMVRLALADDKAGVARWKRIAEAFDQLRTGRAQ